MHVCLHLGEQRAVLLVHSLHLVDVLGHALHLGQRLVEQHVLGRADGGQLPQILEKQWIAQHTLHWSDQ